MIVLCAVAAVAAFNLLKARNAASLEETASQLGVEEDWQAVTHYLYCELIVPGRPIEEIKSEIRKLDSYVIREDLEDPSISIAFEDRYLQLAEGSIYILLNEDDEVRAVSRNVRDDFVAIDCPVVK